MKLSILLLTATNAININQMTVGFPGLSLGGGSGSTTPSGTDDGDSPYLVKERIIADAEANRADDLN